MVRVRVRVRVWVRVRVRDMVIRDRIWVKGQRFKVQLWWLDVKGL